MAKKLVKASHVSTEQRLKTRYIALRSKRAIGLIQLKRFLVLSAFCLPFAFTGAFLLEYTNLSGSPRYHLLRIASVGFLVSAAVAFQTVRALRPRHIASR